jgi:pyruvate kinase
MSDTRTKIVCTIGPSSSSISTLSKMMRAGMSVARLNFSHGTHEEHAQYIAHIRKAARRTGQLTAILQDLQGPKIRVGDLPKDGIELHEKSVISFSVSHKPYREGGAIPVTYKNFHKDVKHGHRIFLDDGMLEARVTSVSRNVVRAHVVYGGILTSHKGINLPDSDISVPPMTKKDEEDLAFGLAHGVDLIALSFVQDAKIVHRVREMIQKKTRSKHVPAPKIIVKIETRSSVENFSEILDAADGIMLARGDLGVEIPPEEVPLVQKEFTEMCRQFGKPIIIATQMMQSMVDHPRATRAETSDVANAVFDHADAVMLSNETAVGEYPVIVVETMAEIVREAEHARVDDVSFYQMHTIPDVETSIAQSIHVMSENEHIDAIATAAGYGDLAARMNVFRPRVPMMLACENKATARQMLIHSGVEPMVLTDTAGTFLQRMEGKLRKQKMIQSKHRVVYVTKATDGRIQMTVK